MFSFLINLWCVQVTVTPELTKTAVFNNGTLNGLNLSKPIGGHLNPKSCDGLKEEWKNVQKNAEKKQISLKINNTIPNFKPSTIKELYSPEIPSRATSRHQYNLDKNKREKNIKNI